MYNADPNAPPQLLIPYDVAKDAADLLEMIQVAAGQAARHMGRDEVDDLYATVMAMGSACSILGRLSAAACKDKYCRDIPLFKKTQDMQEAEAAANNPFATILDFTNTGDEPGEDDGTGQYL